MMTNSPVSTILIIIGITGDLSRRYLLPAIEEIAAAGELPSNFQVIGTSRRALSPGELLNGLSTKTPFLSDRLEIQQLDPTKLGDYQKLSRKLDAAEKLYHGTVQRLFYVSVPPQVAWPVVELLGSSGFSKHANTKLLLEKPFGTDLASAKQLITHTNRYFKEEQVYRIDHYLAKEMAQNLIVFREANPLLKHTWNNEFIERIDITVNESIDIEGRTAFYEQTGALRDVMQSHGLQLAALTLMEPMHDPIKHIPVRRLDALRQLHPPAQQSLSEIAKRAQYQGYRQEVDNPDTTTETYLQLTLASSDPRWEGVPIQITTGKAMPTKVTSICITYRTENELEPNQLTLRVQPNAGIELQLWSKAPGYSRKLEKQTLRFAYDDHVAKLPDAYEQVLLDAITSDHTLFASSQEVLESWRILEPIQHAWQFDTGDLGFYQKGSDPVDRES